MHRSLALPTILTSSALALIGCNGALNNELTTGTTFGDIETPSIGIERTRRTLSTDTNAAEPDPAAQSVLSLDRSNWQPITILAPTDLIVHHPIYTNNVFLNYTNNRTRGEYPTAQSALDMPTTKGNILQAEEALVAPVAAGIDLGIFPIRAIAARPWQRTRTGVDPYQRQPGGLFGDNANSDLPFPATPTGPALVFPNPPATSSSTSAPAVTPR